MLRLTVAVLFLAAVAHTTEFYDCDGINPIIDLRVEGCDTLPCQFPRGKDIVAKMDYAVVSEVSKLKPSVRVKALGMWVNYPIGYDDACSHLSAGACPMYPGDKATYDINIPVLATYPKISIDVEVSLKDQNDMPLVCFMMSGKVVE